MRTETSAGRGSAAVRRVLEAEVDDVRARGTEPPRVVDVGGGSGVWAVPFAVSGCLVTVVEPNPNALATLRRRAAEEGVGERITVVADDSDAVGEHVAAGTADLILAHGLLEVVDAPEQALTALADALAPGGAVSVLAANRHAAVFHRALAGRLGQAQTLLSAPSGVLPEESDTLSRRLSRTELEALVGAVGLEVALLQGDGVVADVAGGVDSGLDTASWQARLSEFELAAAAVPALRDVASRLHAIARKPR